MGKKLHVLVILDMEKNPRLHLLRTRSRALSCLLRLLQAAADRGGLLGRSETNGLAVKVAESWPVEVREREDRGSLERSETSGSIVNIAELVADGRGQKAEDLGSSGRVRLSSRLGQSTSCRDFDLIIERTRLPCLQSTEKMTRSSLVPRNRVFGFRPARKTLRILDPLGRLGLDRGRGESDAFDPSRRPDRSLLHAKEECPDVFPPPTNETGARSRTETEEVVDI